MDPVQLVDRVTVDGTRIVVHPNAEALQPYVREPFWVEYDDDVDVGTWPPTWSLAPFVLNVAPVVWLTGTQAIVDALDANLAASLEAIRARFRDQLYPSLPWTGSLTARRLEPAGPAGPPGSPVGVLFSGGLDSVATSFRQLGQAQTLITVWGADVDEEGHVGWARVRGQAEAFAATYGHGLRCVRSNFRGFLDTWRLDRVDPAIPDWWGYVQHGMGFLGLAAPPLLDQGSTRLYIAASHTSSFAEPWGSSPMIDEAVRLGPLSVVHDGYESSRQTKLREVQEIARARGIPLPPLRVCYANPSGDGTNCGRCEKCLRTVVGLMLEDGDLAASGFTESAAVYVARVRRKFARHTMPSSKNAAWMWHDLQLRAIERLAGGGVDRPLFAWLARFDFGAYARRYGRIRGLRRWLQGVLRGSPRLFALARRWAIRIEER